MPNVRRIGPAAKTYLDTITQGPEEPRERSAWRTILGAGLTGLAGPQVVQNFLADPEEDAQRAYSDRFGRAQLGYDFERQQGQDERQGQIDDLNRRKLLRDLEAPPEPPEQRSLQDLYAGAIEQGDEPGSGRYLKAMQATQRPPTTTPTAPSYVTGEDRIRYRVPQEGPAEPVMRAGVGRLPEGSLDLSQGPPPAPMVPLKVSESRAEFRPSALEERYQLFQTDPEAYRAMYGERGAAQDQSQAARMLQYFARRRQQVISDFGLDEDERAQQLAEIEELERRYFDAAGGNQAVDRVTVMSPDGVEGTIPSSQLPAAQKKGYRLVQ